MNRLKALFFITTFIFPALLALALLTNKREVNTEQSVLTSEPPPQVSILPVLTSKKTVQNLRLNIKRVIPVTGTISDNALEVAKSINRLNTVSSEPIYLVLDSPGGSVVNGNMIVSAMEASKAPINTICLRLCASMAAMIFEFGKERLMVDRSILMFHPASGSAQGEVDRMMSQLTMIQRYIGRLEMFIATRANISYAAYKELSSRELWIDAEDAVNKGFADKYVNVTFSEDLFSMGREDQNDSLIKRNLLDYTW